MNVKQTQAEHRNPAVILLSLFLAVVYSASLLSYFYVIAGYKHLPDAQKAMVQSLPWPDIGLTFFINITILIAALLLFFHRRRALHFFLGAFVATFVRLGWAAFHEGSLERIFGSQSIGEIVVLGLLFLICVYIWRLIRSGVLH